MVDLKSNFGLVGQLNLFLRAKYQNYFTLNCLFKMLLAIQLETPWRAFSLLIMISSVFSFISLSIGPELHDFLPYTFSSLLQSSIHIWDFFMDHLKEISSKNHLSVYFHTFLFVPELTLFSLAYLNLHKYASFLSVASLNCTIYIGYTVSFFASH